VSAPQPRYSLPRPRPAGVARRVPGSVFVSNDRPTGQQNQTLDRAERTQPSTYHTTRLRLLAARGSRPIELLYRPERMTGDVKVQIYTMQSVAEAEAVASLGVDHVGVTPSSRGLPGEVNYALAAEICAEVAGVATSVALSVDVDLGAIEHMVRAVMPDVLHLCGPPGAVGPPAVAELRRALPDVAIMQAVAVTGREAIEIARSYDGVADFLLLDSVSPEIPGVGAAGTVHDWEVSAAVVESVRVPVLLAGGLSPENVAAAIAVVNPWGVDSLTHTNQPVENRRFRKDLDLVSRFVAAARTEVVT